MGTARARVASQSTRVRILEASRIRFNAEGLHAVALYRVAAEIGISQGNLTYHFKTKVDIALDLAESFEAELRVVAAPFLEVPRADRVLVLVERVLIVLWRYRFLLASPTYLAAIDPQLEQRYRLVHRNIRELIRDNTMALVTAGAMRPPRPGAGEIIGDNIVAVWMAWLQIHGSSQDTESDAPTKAMLLDCFRHHFGLLEPYVSKAFVDDLDRALGTFGEAAHAPPS